MKPNFKRFSSFWVGEEFVVHADFQGKRIDIRCRYDTYQRCWSSEVFLVRDGGAHRLAIAPRELYAASKVDSMRRGMRMAMCLIWETGRLTSVPVKSDLIISVREDEFSRATDLAGAANLSPAKRFTSRVVRRLMTTTFWSTMR